MELLQLKYFCDAAESENFSKTAKKFGVPSSDISQSIRRLEKELEASLFSRQPNSITLNDKGREFYGRVSLALSMIGDAVTMLSDDGANGKIKICINTNRRIVMQTIEKYRRIYPGVEIITTHFKDSEKDGFDLIIDSDSPELSEYNKNLLISEKILLAVNDESRHAKAKGVDIRALAEEPFITMSERSSMYSITEKICQDFGFKPKIAMQSDDPYYVRKAVELGLGVTFVPEFSWQGLFSKGVVLREIEGYTRNTYIYTNGKKYTSECVKNFLEMLLSEVN